MLKAFNELYDEARGGGSVGDTEEASESVKEREKGLGVCREEFSRVLDRVRDQIREDGLQREEAGEGRGSRPEQGRAGRKPLFSPSSPSGSRVEETQLRARRRLSPLTFDVRRRTIKRVCASFDDFLGRSSFSSNWSLYVQCHPVY